MNDTHSRVEIDVHGVLGWSLHHPGYGFGGGARVGILLLPDGFLPNHNDSFGLNFGADFMWFHSCHYYNWGAGPARGCGWLGALIGHIDAQWNLYFHEKFSFFIEVGFAPEFYFCGNCDVFWPWFDFAVGGRIHFGGKDSTALLLRLGVHGFNIGISFFP